MVPGPAGHESKPGRIPFQNNLRQWATGYVICSVGSRVNNCGLQDRHSDSEDRFAPGVRRITLRHLQGTDRD